MKIQRILLKPSQVEVDAATQRILYWFFAYPARDFTFNELCKQTKTSKTTARVVIMKLMKRGMLRMTTIGKLWRIAANLESIVFLRAKMAYNFSLVYTSNIVDVVLGLYPQARAVVLFGSYRKGDDADTSDIDIAVEAPGFQHLTIVKIGSLKLGYRKSVPIKVHLFSRDRVDLNVFASIANGFILHGFLEVKP